MASGRAGKQESGIMHHDQRIWRCGRFEFDVTQPSVMGILNVTPDSFSDGGAHANPPEAIRFAETLIAQGADIIDVGGESTRPGSDEVEHVEELSRVLPVVEALAMRGYCVSIDTRHAEVAAVCVEKGASIINDISGFRDPAMVEVAQGCAAGLVAMHMQGEPKSMQETPQYEDVVQEVASYLCSQALMLEEAGVAHERICLDPGVGFGKTAEHNLSLLAATEYLAQLGWPLMVAVSRKGFIGHITGVMQADKRCAGSVAAALYALRHGAAVARVHDVAPTVEALRMLQALDETHHASQVPCV